MDITDLYLRQIEGLKDYINRLKAIESHQFLYPQIPESLNYTHVQFLVHGLFCCEYRIGRKIIDSGGTETAATNLLGFAFTVKQSLNI